MLRNDARNVHLSGLDIRFGVVPLPIYLILAGLIAAIGLRPQNVHRVFDAFYPTKPAAWVWG